MGPNGVVNGSFAANCAPLEFDNVKSLSARASITSLSVSLISTRPVEIKPGASMSVPVLNNNRLIN